MRPHLYAHYTFDTYLDEHSPPKVKRVRIVDNPFEDIVPRITAEEKRAQHRAREQAQREREEEQRRRGAKKCVYLFLEITRGLNICARAIGT